MYTINRLAMAITLSATVAGCAVNDFEEDLKFKPLQTAERELKVQRADTYVREITPQEEILRQRISVSGALSLVDAIKQYVPGVNIKPGDVDVDITRVINIYANNMLVNDYFDYLSALTGYSLDLADDTVVIRSFVTKEWNMATFASDRKVSLSVGSALSGGTGSANVSGQFDNNEWDELVNGVRTMLTGGSDSNKKSTLQTYVNDIRSLGMISAGGDPVRMKIVDQYLTNMSASSQRQINISVQAYDVTLNDERGMGINWSELTNVKGSINGNDFGFNAASASSSSFLPSSLLNTNISYAGSQGKANAVLNFLKGFGEVELLNQPNVTVRNGTYAYISTGEELSFIAETEVIKPENSEVSEGIKFGTVQVGVRLAVVPRILDDNRILLDIWPVVSSVIGTKTASNGDTVQFRPDIALQELSTEVITETGRPIQLGGFIRRQISEQLQELPWASHTAGKIINPLFRNELNELDRREMVITVTPTIVEGV